MADEEDKVRGVGGWRFTREVSIGNVLTIIALAVGAWQYASTWESRIIRVEYRADSYDQRLGEVRQSVETVKKDVTDRLNRIETGVDEVRKTVAYIASRR